MRMSWSTLLPRPGARATGTVFLSHGSLAWILGSGAVTFRVTLPRLASEAFRFLGGCDWATSPRSHRAARITRHRARPVPPRRHGHGAQPRPDEVMLRASSTGADATQPAVAATGPFFAPLVRWGQGRLRRCGATARAAARPRARRRRRRTRRRLPRARPTAPRKSRPTKPRRGSLRRGHPRPARRRYRRRGLRSAVPRLTRRGRDGHRRSRRVAVHRARLPGRPRRPPSAERGAARGLPPEADTTNEVFFSGWGRPAPDDIDDSDAPDLEDIDEGEVNTGIVAMGPSSWVVSAVRREMRGAARRGRKGLCRIRGVFHELAFALWFRRYQSVRTDTKVG